ncbi:MAG: sulfite exporter TauE/SafE family protein [Pyrinomonadaceae bacterium]
MHFDLLIVLAVFVVAILYSSVGHGGGSGYLAVMAFFSIAPEITKPTALTLNLFVSAIAFAQFWRKGHFGTRIFLSFAVTSIPASFVGGLINLPISYYKVLLGLVLLFAAVRLAWNMSGQTDEEKDVRLPMALGIGALIGLTSGLIGVGGGIFLTPILVLTGWANPKRAAGISALFIFVNSAAGLAGSFQKASALTSNVAIWIGVAIIGGLIGSTLGASYFNSIWLRRSLSVVLIGAGLKLLLV